MDIIYNSVIFFRMILVLVWVICGIISIKSKRTESLGVALFMTLIILFCEATK